NGWFARWYIHHLLPTLPAHIPISVHDVFHQRHALPFTEGAVILKWLDNNTTNHFTAPAARTPHTPQKPTEPQKKLQLAEPPHTHQHLTPTHKKRGRCDNTPHTTAQNTKPQISPPQPPPTKTQNPPPQQPPPPAHPPHQPHQPQSAKNSPADPNSPCAPHAAH